MARSKTGAVCIGQWARYKIGNGENRCVSSSLDVLNNSKCKILGQLLTVGKMATSINSFKGNKITEVVACGPSLLGSVYSTKFHHKVIFPTSPITAFERNFSLHNHSGLLFYLQLRLNVIQEQVILPQQDSCLSKKPGVIENHIIKTVVSTGKGAQGLKSFVLAKLFFQENFQKQKYIALFNSSKSILLLQCKNTEAIYYKVYWTIIA